jgi:3-dehydroquinate synthase
VAHKLEQLSDFRIGHGDAVAIGLAVDLLYSARIGLVKEATAYRAIDLIERLGFSTYDTILHQVDKDDISVILKGLDEFREHLGGELTITLIQGIGEGVEVHAMDKMHIKSALDELRARHLAIPAK